MSLKSKLFDSALGLTFVNFIWILLCAYIIPAIINNNDENHIKDYLALLIVSFLSIWINICIFANIFIDIYLRAKELKQDKK